MTHPSRSTDRLVLDEATPKSQPPDFTLPKPIRRDPRVRDN